MDIASGTRVYVFFAILGFDEDIDQVTQIMGTEPDRSWVKGEPRPPSPRGRHTHSRWALDSGLDESESVEDHLDALLTKLECVSSGVSECTKRFRTCIWIAIYSSECESFVIDAAAARRIADLGLSVDVDPYRLPGGDARWSTQEIERV